jgi:hypothetical protein
MDVAGIYFAILIMILLALQDKSVSFHFAKNLDLDELDFFLTHCRLLPSSCSVNLNTWSWWASEVAFFLNLPKSKLMNFSQ